MLLLFILMKSQFLCICQVGFILNNNNEVARKEEDTKMWFDSQVLYVYNSTFSESYQIHNIQKGNISIENPYPDFIHYDPILNQLSYYGDQAIEEKPLTVSLTTASSTQSISITLKPHRYHYSYCLKHRISSGKWCSCLCN